MKQLYVLHLSVVLRAPWLVHGNDPGHLGLDAVQLRGPDGRRVLPGSLLIGRLRDAWTELATLPNAPDVAMWLGPTRRADDEHDASREPRRTRLFSDDLIETSKLPTDAVWPGNRLKMDKASGAGEEGMLQFIEQREAPGTEIAFTGTWRAWLDKAEAEALPAWIAKGLRWHTQLGALRNVGFGAVAGVSVRAQLAQASAEVEAGPPAEFVGGHEDWPRGLILRFDQPLAVSNRRINGNLYASGDIIPGAAIKGALATTLRAEGKAIPSWFNDLRITHALPSADKRRPAPLPLSLVADRHANVWESRTDGAALHAGEALAFRHDWKTAQLHAAQVRQGWGRTSKYLRVRTAIEDGHAADSALFAYECTLADANPAAQAGAPALTCWTATLDLPGASAAQWQEIASLLSRGSLGPIGKTDAFAAVELASGLAPRWAPSIAPAPGREARVMLMSDGLLFPTAWVEGHTSASSVDLLAVYRKAFAAIAAATMAGGDEAMTLSCFFARQRLTGGDYLRRRRRPAQAGDYRPYVLTEAGSVFVFSIGDAAKAAALLQRWQRHGLPLGHDVAQHHGGDWMTNPYIPQNGYGEVCVDPQHGFEPLPDDHPRRS